MFPAQKRLAFSFLIPVAFGAAACDPGEGADTGAIHESEAPAPGRNIPSRPALAEGADRQQTCTERNRQEPVELERSA